MKPIWILLPLILLASAVRGETLVANARPVLTKAALTNTLAGAYVCASNSVLGQQFRKIG